MAATATAAAAGITTITITTTTRATVPATHTKARSAEVYATRLAVPDDKVSWLVLFPEYKPVYFEEAKLPKLPVEQKSDSDSMVLNPVGRTGLTGRGKLYRLGPNHAADAVVFRTTEDGHVEILVMRRSDSTRDDEFALVGGFVDLDVGETAWETCVREFVEETHDGQSFASPAIQSLFAAPKKAVHMYVDDPRNTDQAWMVTTAFAVEWKPEWDAVLGEVSTWKSAEASDFGWKRMEDIQSGAVRMYASHQDVILAAMTA